MHYLLYARKYLLWIGPYYMITALLSDSVATPFLTLKFIDGFSPNYEEVLAVNKIIRI